MEYHILFVYYFTALILVLSVSDCAALSGNQQIKDGNTIVSQNELFELGFFSPGKSKNRYVGIWYKKISTGTVVWVANRQTPIPDNSGMFSVTREGALQIFSGDRTEIWSSKFTGSLGDENPVVELLDIGNLVVWDKNSSNRNLIWESFDYPGDTLLPGMKFGEDLVTGLVWSMTSWKTPDDPSTGMYNSNLDKSGYPQIFGKKGSVILSRLGPWNGVRFSGFPAKTEYPIYVDEFVNNDKEIYHKYELIGSVYGRRVLRWDGKFVIFQWIDRVQEWIVYADNGADTSCPFELCGPYGTCNINNIPPCGCVQGFEPSVPEEWKASDWSSGCQRKTPLDCGNGDGFWKISRVKLPDTRFSWYNYSMNLGECEMACTRNCSCSAYANLDIRNGGSGCLLWFGGLMDIREYEDEDQNIFVRMAGAESAGYMFSPSHPIKRRVLTVVLSVSSAALLLSAVAYYACRKREKRLREKEKEKDMDMNTTEHLDDIPSFSLYQVTKATDNFNISNQIGEGGFGPVYKGVLEDGQEVAVKRLSESSKQGINEFKNELFSIAKLQHRNLVKLLGYCIHGNEMILIYEYMANKSLDSFLFDETRSLQLDWPQRYHIIHGIARGILYLHQDSRLQIIHRDLKAGNILLDIDMNPKISDFGLAKKFIGHDTIDKTKKVVGTYGYIPPEYALHGRFSVKSDVFSFGVLVLEIVSGMNIREFSHENHSDNLLGHAWRLFNEDKSIELISESLRASCVFPEVVRSIHVALLCVQHHAKDRPTILSVLLMLVSDSALPTPKQPAFFTEESISQLSSSFDDGYMITRLYPR